MKISSSLQRSLEIDQRKKLLARKEMEQAYKRNAKFAEASENPLLVALENLLSGKTEKELHEQDTDFNKQEQLSNIDTTQFPQSPSYTPNKQHENQVSIDNVNKVSLTNIPERTLSLLEKGRTPELEKGIFTRTFNKAKSTYSAHIAMVKNSYLIYNEPQFSMAI